MTISLRYLLLLVLLTVVAWGANILLGWGIAFAFAAKVIVPWLGVPATWSNTATLICSIALSGIGAIAMVLAEVTIVALICTLLSYFLKRRS